MILFGWLISNPVGLAAFVERYKAFLATPILIGVFFVLTFLFKSTWKELDDEAYTFRTELRSAGKMDFRPLVALVMSAVILTAQDYYGGHSTFYNVIRPKLEKVNLLFTRSKELHTDVFGLIKYTELWGYLWWVFTRIAGYITPFFLWRLFFKNDALLDMGLRTKGFFKHIWIYALFLVVVLPCMFFVSRAPDFGNYYPFYKLSSRSWFDFLLWESMYLTQFFFLELFFRGFWLHALRKSFGSGAIFSMIVPYGMIHYGKPYLEAMGAIIAGTALGSLSMKTKSIYQGFLVHVTVALLMDWLALYHRQGLPQTFWP